MPLFRKPRSPYFWYDFRTRGRRYRGSTREVSEQQALEFVERLRLLIGSHRIASEESPAFTVRMLILSFLSFNEANQELSARTRDYYGLGAKRLLETKLADVRLDAVSSSMIATLRLRGSASYVNLALRTLKRAFSYGEDIGVLNKAPRVRLARERMRTRIFTNQEELRLLKAAPQPLYDVALLMMNTGARPSEVMSIRWNDVDWERQTIHVRRSKTAAGERFLGFTSEVQEVLTRRLLTAEGPFIFASVKSKCGHLTTVAKQFTVARKQAALDPALVLYSLRHTYATNLMAECGNRSLVAAQMGHSTASSTERYIHPDVTKVAGFAEQLIRRRRAAADFLEKSS